MVLIIYAFVEETFYKSARAFFNRYDFLLKENLICYKTVNVDLFLTQT